MIEPSALMVQLVVDEVPDGKAVREHIERGLSHALDLIADDVRTVLCSRPHAHRVPGVWDRNGLPCAECIARKRLTAIFDQDGRS